MDEIDVKYDREGGTLQVKFDRELNLDSLSKAKERADGIGMMTRIGIGSLRTLIGIYRVRLESRLSEMAEKAGKVPEEIGTQEETGGES